MLLLGSAEEKVEWRVERLMQKFRVLVDVSEYLNRSCEKANDLLVLTGNGTGQIVVFVDRLERAVSKLYHGRVGTWTLHDDIPLVNFLTVLIVETCELHNRV